ncbi:MAG: hypothetical protein ABIR46_01200 [Candidatus Saccharimonadales bacterium]
MKNNQAGGIVTFLVIALALAGLLAGGLYASKQMGRADRTNDTSTPQVTQNEDKTQSEDEEDVAQREQDEAAPSTTTPKADNTPESKPTTTPPASAPPTAATPTDRVANTGPSDTLPATGPAETTAAVFVLSGLTFALYRHAQSRRHLRRNALHR